MPSISEDSLASDTTQAPPPAQQGIDTLFDRGIDKAQWVAPRPPDVLGELLDSRCMLPLVLPSDARLLAVVPAGQVAADASGVAPPLNGMSKRNSGSRSPRKAPSVSAMEWEPRVKMARDVRVELLDSVDGVYSLLRRTQVDPEVDLTVQDEDGEEVDIVDEPEHEEHSDLGSSVNSGSRAGSPQFTAVLSARPSVHLRAGRASTGGPGMEDEEVGIAL